jgi:hypothetical protein
MKFRASDLWRLDGTIDRLPYFVLGTSLGILKIGLDFLVATRFFRREWSPFEYAVPGHLGGLFDMGNQDRYFYRLMLLNALPFVFCGVALTLRRLRSAGLPLYAVILFFAPMPMNLIVFLALSLLPPRQAKTAAGDMLADEVGSIAAAKKPGILDKTIPENRLGSALAAILLPMPFAMAFCALSVTVLQNYGWGLFVGIPFALPMISVILYGYHHPRRLSECLSLGMTWLLIAYGLLLLFAFEGIICLVMALPLAIPIVLMGSAVGYVIQARGLGSGDAARLMVVVMAALPGMIGAEAATRPQAPIFCVQTSIEVAATPDRVWSHVVRFDPLPPPAAGDWVFRTGLAYPIGTEIEGQGVGAIRRCEFSTGPLIEPIEVWDEPRLLQFAVTKNPAPMREWNPLAEIHPPHLDGFLVAQRGQFRLVELPGGRTLVEGTSWYQHHLWPAAYWRLWSDPIIHRIHKRVLEHIKQSAERASR